MTTEAEDYIEYFMWRHSGQLTVNEIAAWLGVQTSKIYDIAKQHQIPTKRRQKSKQDCTNRPYCCYTCIAPDCFCREAANDAEKALWGYGKADKGERW